MGFFARNKDQQVKTLSARVACGWIALLFLLAPALAQDKSDGPKPCRGARFKSPWDNSYEVLASVKSGESCQIKLPLDNVTKATMLRNARLGKTEPVSNSADLTFTPNKSISGRDQFIYEVERTDKDIPVKQVIRVDIHVLKAKDYPVQNVFKEEPLPESSNTKTASSETKTATK